MDHPFCYSWPPCTPGWPLGHSVRLPAFDPWLATHYGSDSDSAEKGEGGGRNSAEKGDGDGDSVAGGAAAASEEVVVSEVEDDECCEICNM